jgi:hypothetical protein
MVKIRPPLSACFQMPNAYAIVKPLQLLYPHLIDTPLVVATTCSLLELQTVQRTENTLFIQNPQWFKLLHIVTPADLSFSARSLISTTLPHSADFYPILTAQKHILVLSIPHLRFTLTASLFTYPFANKASSTSCVLIRSAKHLLFQPTNKEIRKQQDQLQDLPEPPSRATSKS